MTLCTSIRPVLQSEAPLLQKLAERTFIDAFGPANSADKIEAYVKNALCLDQVAKELDNPNSHFFFIRQGERVAGYLKLNMGEAQSADSMGGLEIERIYVSSEHQGKRLGTSLLDHAIEFAKSSGCEFVWLGVWDKNPDAIRFYGRHGFVAFDEHTFMLSDEPKVDILMRRDVPF